jgi:hypothetical protein
MTAHPVLIATNGIDFTIMRQNAEWLRQFPSWHGVGRIALMIDCKRRHKALIKQVWEKGRYLLGKEHAFINDRPARTSEQR